MKKNILGKTGIQVSEIGFGVLPVGPRQMDLAVSEGAKVLKYALEKGINFIDTAQYYQTYPYIKEALKELPPEIPRPVICSKCHDESYEEMEKAIDEMLEFLGLDFIDIFLLHELRTGDFKKRNGAWQCLQDAKAKGKVKVIGISTHHVDVVVELNQVPECDVIFPLINYAGLGIRNGMNPGSREDMEAAIADACKAGKGVFTMKAFGGGPLVGDYIKCLDYNMGISGTASTMIGFGSISDVDDIFSYLDGELPNGFVPNIKEKKMRIEKGSCEGCGQCIKVCSNEAIAFSRVDGLAEIDISKCMTCGYCTPVCPFRAIIMY